MASDGQKRLRGKSATLGVADVMDVFLVMVLATRGQVVIANQTLEVIGGTEAHLEYMKFTEFIETNPPTFRVDFNPNEAEGWIEALEGTFFMLACIGLQKVTFATYMLEAGVEAWWANAKRLSRTPGPSLHGMCSKLHSTVKALS